MPNAVEAKPLDEAAWQAWTQKGIAREQRRNASLERAWKWTLLLALATAALYAAALTPLQRGAGIVGAASMVVVLSRWFELGTPGMPGAATAARPVHRKESA